MTEDGLKNNLIAFDGFLGLIKTMLDKHKYDIPWTILRQFDYENNFEYAIDEDISKKRRYKNLKSIISTITFL